jgi:uncharacterized membrane protein
VAGAAVTSPTAEGTAPEAVPNHLSQNIESVLAHQRQQEQLRGTERRLELVSSFVGRPVYLIALVAVVTLWILLNAVAPRFGWTPFDPSPFSRLQGLLTLAALATSTIVVIAQRRQARLENQRAHLDLQVNLLTEQKVTKVIHLLEELRRDLPMVRDRFDPEAEALQQRTDTAHVLSALEEVGVGHEAHRAAHST